jgi:hypothetical protein
MAAFSGYAIFMRNCAIMALIHILLQKNFKTPNMMTVRIYTGAMKSEETVTPVRGSFTVYINE